jgi:hypothetical protein
MIVLKKKNLIIFVTIFLISRILTYYYFGFKSDYPLGTLHLPSEDLLFNDLLNTIKYWHFSQYFFIIFFGLILKIFNGNIFFVNGVWIFYSFLLSVGIIYYGIKIGIEFQLSKKQIFLLTIFLIINPNIIFYENYSSPVYIHTTCFLFSQLTFFFFKFYKKKNNFYTEISIYINLLILSLTWSLFHPFLILLIFFFIQYFKKKFDFNISIIFLIIFSLSILPSIKNKFVFNFFGNASNLGSNLSTTLPGHANECNGLILEKERWLFNISNDPNLHIILKSNLQNGIEWNANHIGNITGSKKCFEWSFKKIVNEPEVYFKSRLYSFIASHSKFAFEFVVGSPKKLIFLLDFSSNKKIKLLKQIIIFIYMSIVYGFFFYFLCFKKNIFNYKKSFFLIFFTYSWLLITSHLLNGYEQERMLYTGLFIHLVFWLNIFKLRSNFKKNKLII